MTNTFTGVDKNAAAYWNSAVTRKEIQPIFSELSDAINKQSEVQAVANMTIAFLIQKFGISQAEFQAFVSTKTAELQAAQAPVDAPKDLITECV